MIVKDREREPHQLRESFCLCLLIIKKLLVSFCGFRAILNSKMNKKHFASLAANTLTSKRQEYSKFKITHLINFILNIVRT